MVGWGPIAEYSCKTSQFAFFKVTSYVRAFDIDFNNHQTSDVRDRKANNLNSDGGWSIRISVSSNLLFIHVLRFKKLKYACVECFL